jgi:hypothetical protein
MLTGESPEQSTVDALAETPVGPVALPTIQ